MYVLITVSPGTECTQSRVTSYVSLQFTLTFSPSTRRRRFFFVTPTPPYPQRKIDHGDSSSTVAASLACRPEFKCLFFYGSPSRIVGSEQCSRSRHVLEYVVVVSNSNETAVVDGSCRTVSGHGRRQGIEHRSSTSKRRKGFSSS